eukprot:155140-Prorocentrum_minimum.AAC.1
MDQSDTASGGIFSPAPPRGASTAPAADIYCKHIPARECQTKQGISQVPECQTQQGISRVPECKTKQGISRVPECQTKQGISQ